MHSSKLEIILLYETHDLEVMEAFLPSFLVFKVASDMPSQKVWDRLHAEAKSLPGVGVGLIREEWKQSASFFSQRYGVKHLCPQLVLVKRAQALHVWSGDDCSNLFSVAQIEKEHVRHDRSLQALVSFFKLGQLGELETRDPRWQIEWLKDFQKGLTHAHLSASMRNDLESFCDTWLKKFPGEWSGYPSHEKAQFFTQAQAVYRIWWKEVSNG